MHRIGEDEVIAVFLRGELDSGRYGATLCGLLVRDGRDAQVLRHADLDVASDNAYRRRLLDEHRAYDRREGLFLDFPRRVSWSRAALGQAEVLDILCPLPGIPARGARDRPRHVRRDGELVSVLDTGGRG
jgi:hypothetical protein